MTLLHDPSQPYDVDIGDGTLYGNPFRLERDGRPAEVLAKYRRWLWGEIQVGRIDLAELGGLQAKRLRCDCFPEPCHGEVLLNASWWALCERTREIAARVKELTQCGGYDEDGEPFYDPHSGWGDA